MLATYLHSKLQHLQNVRSCGCPIRDYCIQSASIQIPNSRHCRGISGQILVRMNHHSWLHQHCPSIQAVDKRPSRQGHPNCHHRLSPIGLCGRSQPCRHLDCTRQAGGFPPLFHLSKQRYKTSSMRSPQK